MASHWGLVIKQLREERGLSQSELARRSGLRPSHISRIEAGAYQNSHHRTIERLAYGLNMTINELTHKLKGDVPFVYHETPEQILDRFRVTLPESVPIYEEFTLHAGRPVEAIDYIPVVREQAKGKRLEGYIVRGSSLSPQVEDGDIIIIDRDRETDNGDIVASLVQGELRLARLRRIADELYLENNNGRIKLEDDMIAAPVIEVRRRLK